MIDVLKQDQDMWDLYTSREEYDPLVLDRFLRFPYYLSSNKNIFKPIVSKYLMSKGLKVEYPEGKRFAVCLTHDIDTVHPRIGNVVYGTARSLLHGRLGEAMATPLSMVSKKWNPLWSFDTIMAVEEKYGAKSSFYFITSDNNANAINYHIEDLRDELRTLSDNGWEVGLHGGYYSYNSFKDIVEEKGRLESALGKAVIGYRNHVLRFKVPDTWELLSKAGFKYDSTFGYADCVGFRNGSCYPYQPFNLHDGKAIDILEIPLNIMECTLFDYMRLDLDSSWRVIKMLIDSVEKYKGVATILWHNNYMHGDKLKLYEKILQYCREKNAWMTSGEQIFRSNIFT